MKAMQSVSTMSAVSYMSSVAKAEPNAARALADKCCAVCKKSESALAKDVKLKHCARCKKVLYCARECQKQHWKIHKKDCAKLAAEGAK